MGFKLSRCNASLEYARHYVVLHDITQNVPTSQSILTFRKRPWRMNRNTKRNRVNDLDSASMGHLRMFSSRLVSIERIKRQLKSAKAGWPATNGVFDPKRSLAFMPIGPSFEAETVFTKTNALSGHFRWFGTEFLEFAISLTFQLCLFLWSLWLRRRHWIML